jgi:hypothetical protein
MLVNVVVFWIVTKMQLKISSRRGLGTVGHTGTFGLEPSNSLGELVSTVVGEILPQQTGS